MILFSPRFKFVEKKNRHILSGQSLTLDTFDFSGVWFTFYHLITKQLAIFKQTNFRVFLEFKFVFCIAVGSWQQLYYRLWCWYYGSVTGSRSSPNSSNRSAELIKNGEHQPYRRHFFKPFRIFMFAFSVCTVEVRALCMSVEELHQKVDVLSLNFQKIMAHIAPQETAIMRPEGMPSLPLKGEEDFDQFEKYLKDEVSFNQTVRKFCFIFLNLVRGFFSNFCLQRPPHNGRFSWQAMLFKWADWIANTSKNKLKCRLFLNTQRRIFNTFLFNFRLFILMPGAFSTRKLKRRVKLPCF